MKKFLYMIVAVVLLGCSSPVQPTQLDITVEGMSCSHSCAPYIQKNLNKTEGVIEATVEFETKSAKVVIDKNVVSKEEIIKKIETIAEGQYKVESCEESKIESSNNESTQEVEESSSNFDITDQNVSTEGYKLPNLFKVLTRLLK